MSFLDWIANWAEEHIPLVGGWIAELVRKIQSAIEGAYGWVKKAVSWIENTWIPWAERTIDSISLSLSNAWTRIQQYIEPAISALEKGLNWVEDGLSSLARALDDLINNLPQIIYDNIPDWIKDGVKNALDEISKIWSSLNSLWDDFWNWVNNAGSWFQEQLHNAKPIIDSWIHKITDPIEGWIDWFKREFDEFLEDPVSYIRRVNDPITSYILQKLDKLVNWANEKVDDLTDAVLSIDDYILTKLEEFILSLIMWFISTLIDDLTHLQYDPETKQVYGTPKNPLTHILIWFFEVEKPENPYQSVKPQMGVEEHEVGTHGWW